MAVPVNTLDDLDTPALVLERGVLARNVRAMTDRARRLGVSLRPHLKTAKCVEVAAMATRGQPGGITVSTLREAEYFAERGFDDLTYAVGIVPRKLGRVAALLRAGARLRILTDDAEVARRIGECGREEGLEFPVLIELDCGAGRGGVEPCGETLIEVGRILHERPGATLCGVLTHAGHAYDCRDPRQIRQVAEQERLAAVSAAQRLSAAGLPCETVSVGSTPTAVCAERLDGITEIRPGTYVFYDLFQEGLGVCGREDIAVSVLTSVIGRSARGEVLIDAGALALSQDIGANRGGRHVGYGLVLDVAGRPIEPGLHVRAVHQEHGFVSSEEGRPLPDLRPGARLRVLPNHACTTAAMFDRYQVVENGKTIVDVWKRVNRW